MLTNPWDSTVPPVRPNRQQPELKPPCHSGVFIFRNLFHNFACLGRTGGTVLSQGKFNIRFFLIF